MYSRLSGGVYHMSSVWFIGGIKMQGGNCRGIEPIKHVNHSGGREANDHGCEVLAVSLVK
jgi:hypothetical protein